jgi:hypothetical protein
MKRIVCAVLALTLLGSTAASARGWNHGGYYGRGFHHHHGGDGVALGFGLGILALGIIAAESAHERDRYRAEDRYYDEDRYRDDNDRYGDEYVDPNRDGTREDYGDEDRPGDSDPDGR